jgi:methylmalonyl-CoA mutase
MIKRDFFPFPNTTPTDWQEQIQKDLKGKDFESTLNSTVWESVKISPFYTSKKDKTPSPPIIFNKPSPFPGQNPRIWHNLVSIFPRDVKEANQEILDSLENGAEGLVLHLIGTEDLNQILKGVLTEYIQLYFYPLKDPTVLIHQIQNWIESISLRIDMLHGGIFWSPTSSLFMGKESLGQEIPNAILLFKYFKSFQNFNPITIDFARYANSGATGIQELVFGLGELIELFDSFISNGVSPSQALGQMGFVVSTGEQHFAEIAKLKALRVLIAELAMNLGSPISTDSLHFIVSTSLWTKSRIDKNSNLIRQTYETMAGILGGANSIWVRPVSEKTATKLEKRIARNIPNILKEESYLDKVMDPASGTYFLEDLQNQIHDQVVAQLAELEKNGGWEESFTTRALHTQVRSTRKSIQESVLSNQKKLIGVNKYQGKAGLAEDLPTELIEEKDFELSPSSASYLVEIQNVTNS